jgi:hypothetical protein
MRMLPIEATRLQLAAVWHTSTARASNPGQAQFHPLKLLLVPPPAASGTDTILLFTDVRYVLSASRARQSKPVINITKSLPQALLDPPGDNPGRHALVDEHNIPVDNVWIIPIPRLPDILVKWMGFLFVSPASLLQFLGRWLHSCFHPLPLLFRTNVSTSFVARSIATGILNSMISHFCQPLL